MIRARGKKGIYHAAIYDPSIGRKRWRTLKTSDPTRAAILYADELKKISPDQKLNLEWEPFKQEYLRESRPHKKQDTQDFDAIALEKFEQFFKPKKVRQLTTQLLKRWQTALFEEGLKPSSVNRYMALLKAMGKVAFEKGYLHENKFSLVKDLKEPETEADAYSADQVHALFECVRPDKNFDEELFLLVAFSTPLRRGEMRNFEIEDVDFNLKVVYVRRKGAWTPKSHKPRWFPLSDRLGARLIKLKAANHKGYVLTYKGKQVKKYYLSDKFERLLKRAKVVKEVYDEGKRKKVKKVIGTVHWTRHTWITEMLNAGEDPLKVQIWAGHANKKTTFKIYNHLKPGNVGWGKINSLSYFG